MAREREKIQKEINRLNTERKSFVAKKMKELSKSGEDTFDSAMIKAVRKQMKKQNFQFSDESK